jgi:hypothetical protein
MSGHTIDDATTLRHLLIVVGCLVGVSAGLIVAVSLIA